MKKELFHPAVQSWLVNTYNRPTPAQERAWPVIKEGKHTLIAAPTGSGKTLAAFLSAIDDLVREAVGEKGGEKRSDPDCGSDPFSPGPGLKDEVYVLYVSPLKALSNDIHKNLEEPLSGITELLAESGPGEEDLFSEEKPSFPRRRESSTGISGRNGAERHSGQTF